MINFQKHTKEVCVTFLSWITKLWNTVSVTLRVKTKPKTHMTVAAWSSKTIVSYHIAMCHNPEDHDLEIKLLLCLNTMT